PTTAAAAVPAFVEGGNAPFPKAQMRAESLEAPPAGPFAAYTAAGDIVAECVARGGTDAGLLNCCD
ncbi:MAG: hypothetical protein QMC17_09305, partial [Paracoccaceae bacterium]